MPTIILTGSGSWVVPSDWNPANNTIICIGAGGGAGIFGTGGGGGAYSQISNSFTPNTVVYYRVGAGGTGGSTDNVLNIFPASAGQSTWINSAGNFAPASTATGCLAAGGSAGPSGTANTPTTTAALGGAAASCIGSVTGSGGNSGAAGGSGGGGAGGANVTGGTAPSTAGGNGGAGGGTGGGAGGIGSTSVAGGTGGTGTTYTATLQWNGSTQISGSFVAGPGGGGGGTLSSPGGVGGNYGGGGSASDGPTKNTASGAGANGIIIITYGTASYVMPSSGPITMNDINRNYYSVDTARTLGDPEVYYLGQASPNPLQTGFIASGENSFGNMYNKPNPSSGNTFPLYTTPGTYQFFMPVNRTFTVFLAGGGGGEGGAGRGVFNPCAGCNNQFTPCTCCSGFCCSFACGCFQQAGFTICACCSAGTTYLCGSGGSTGNPSSIGFALSTYGTTVTMATAYGGGGGSGWCNGSTNGTEAQEPLYPSPYNLAPHPYNPYTAPAGGSGATNGGEGASGGTASIAITHNQTTGWPVWANGTGVTKFIITVGGGGAGGAGNTAGTDLPGNPGASGYVYITWI